jgi:hypothetical protein
MDESEEQTLRRAIALISQSDPLIKLLQQVRLGRLTPGDAGLRAVTESWLAAYRNIFVTERLSGETLRRLDPRPRLAVLLDAGVVSTDRPSAKALTETFEQVLASSTE